MPEYIEHPPQKHKHVKRLVVKVGGGFLYDKVDGGYTPCNDQFAALTHEIAEIMRRRKVVLVSSGAVATAVAMEGISVPDDPYEKAKLAGKGQPRLMMKYIAHFENYGIRCSQCLLTHNNITYTDKSDVDYSTHVRRVIEGWLDDDVIPIVNENDTVSTDDIKFGDNDILAAMLTQYLSADLLVILTHKSGDLGTGGSKSKDRARKILAQGEKPIPLEINRKRYELNDDIWQPKIRLYLAD